MLQYNTIQLKPKSCDLATDYARQSSTTPRPSSPAYRAPDAMNRCVCLPAPRFLAVSLLPATPAAPPPPHRHAAVDLARRAINRLHANSYVLALVAHWPQVLPCSTRPPARPLARQDLAIRTISSACLLCTRRSIPRTTPSVPSLLYILAEFSSAARLSVQAHTRAQAQARARRARSLRRVVSVWRCALHMRHVARMLASSASL